jgi:phosphosulfolactate synthase (CoM biosynthesis protein A)
MESEGITENNYIGTKGGSGEGAIDKELWNTNVVTKFINALGLRNIMFEAAEKEVFTYYIDNYGPGVNLFVDNSQINALEMVRSNVFFGSVAENTTTYKG